MSEATKAKSARARATIAARKLKATRPSWDGGNGLGRSFDDCLEMGDGQQVYEILIDRAVADPVLLEAMRAHGMDSWVAEVRRRMAAEEEALTAARLLFA